MQKAKAVFNPVLMRNCSLFQMLNRAHMIQEKYEGNYPLQCTTSIRISTTKFLFCRCTFVIIHLQKIT